MTGAETVEHTYFYPAKAGQALYPPPEQISFGTEIMGRPGEHPMEMNGWRIASHLARALASTCFYLF